MLGELIGDLIGGLLGGLLRAGRANTADVRVVAGLRIPGGGLRARWRHGYLSFGPDAECSWVPSRLRPGRRIPLPGLKIGDSRRMTAIEEWLWLSPGCRILSAVSEGRVVELAILSDDIAEVRRRVIILG